MYELMRLFAQEDQNIQPKKSALAICSCGWLKISSPSDCQIYIYLYDTKINETADKNIL